MLNNIRKVFEKVYYKGYRCLPFPVARAAELERAFAEAQGKGWGGGSISQEVAACRSLLKAPPKIVLDIGANKGCYTRSLLQMFPEAVYYLFEPSKVNVAHLKNEFLGMNNVVLNSIALSDHSSVETLYSDVPGSCLGSLSKRRLHHFGIPFEGREQITVERFDVWWAARGIDRDTPIDYVKMDVEGHELAVLCGFGDVIGKVRLCQFEFGGCNIDSRTFFQDFWYFFKERGFRLYRITPCGPVLMRGYRESDEFFSTTNYIAVNSASVEE